MSVIAVKIQLSSPRGVLRSDILPGMFRPSAKVGPPGKGFCRMKKRTAISMGVVRQDVKISAGRPGFVGRVSSSRQAAR